MACFVAPFGQGKSHPIFEKCLNPSRSANITVLDESPRKTWQLNPDQFELRHPKWPSMVRKATEQVAQELGCVEPASVNAQLYMMLLYVERAMFEPHKEYAISFCNVLIVLIYS